MTHLNRRKLIKAAGSASILLPFANQALSQEKVDGEPHFILHYSMMGGLDKLYTFDSRPLDMTKEKMQVNFLDRDPIKESNATGGVMYRSHLTNDLMKHFPNFAVLNGVMMSPSFDGHIENENELFSGQSLGGDFYMPDFNTSEGKAPIDFMQMGQGILLGKLSNMGGGVNFTLGAAYNLKSKVDKLRDLEQKPVLNDYLRKSFTPALHEKGAFASARMKMKNAFNNTSRLSNAILGLELPDPDSIQPDQNQLPGDLELITSIFKSGVSRSAMYIAAGFTPGRQLDAHDRETCKQSPTIIKNYIDDMTMIFDHLSKTPYDDQRSMLDVTTVVISTEISRTMRSISESIDFEKSGTDHNQLANTVIVGGKGIKGGQVIGSSDLQTVSEYKSGVSKAHLVKDNRKLKTMGRPFDFDTFQERTDQPESFDVRDYLSINNIINSLYSIAGIEESKWRKIGQSQDKFRVLNNLLS